MNSKGKEEEKIIYYYKKPGSNEGDPSVLMSVSGIHSKGGEIIIGTENCEPTIERMIVMVTRASIDPEFHKIIQKI